MKSAIIIFPGTNREREMITALGEALGNQPMLYGTERITFRKLIWLFCQAVFHMEIILGLVQWQLILQLLQK